MTRWRVREELPQNATEIELLLLTEVPPPAFRDVGDAVWFIIVTFTTVGFGDLTPNGHMAKFVTVLAIFAGVTLFAMPIAIVGKNFIIAWDERSKTQVSKDAKLCPLTLSTKPL